MIKPLVQCKRQLNMLKKIQHSDSAQQLSLAMIINDNDVSLIAEPKSLFKIIQIINQWIKNIVHHYEDQLVINNEQTWYYKWKVLYPIIHSSKRLVIEVYWFITEDLLLAPTASVFDVLNQFLDTIPELSTYQTLTSINGNDINPNYMRYALQLCYTSYIDPNNQFASIASNSVENYHTFTDNKSIMTWNTAMSVTSIASVPSIVTTTKSVVETNIQKKWTGKQLDQYYGQDTFGEPCKLPTGANVLNLLWYYNIKTDGLLKAKMVCNGKPSNKIRQFWLYLC
jgi:hypothetical protein